MFGEDPESKKFLAEQQSLWVATEVLANYLGRADEFDAVCNTYPLAMMYFCVYFFDANSRNLGL